MSKAICIQKALVFPNGVDILPNDVYITDHAAVLNAKTTLEDRSTCETDQSLLQIIPYITLYDKTTKDLFIYSRGKGSGEQRLAGKCSIGLGGHMELENADMSLTEIIVTEAVRELEEEIGLEPTEELHKVLRDKLVSGNVGMMYNSRTEVDRVHLAIAFFVAVDAKDIMSKPHEADVITRGQWMSIADIGRAVKAETFEVEHWTRMVMESINYSWI